MNRNQKFGMAVVLLLGIVAAISILVVPDKYVQRVSRTLNVILLVALVLVTMLYAKKTSDIANETRKQVSATTASVAEMEKQRHLSTQPWVFPDLPAKGIDLLGPTFLKFENICRGPAIGVKLVLFVDTIDVAKIVSEWKQRTGPTFSNITGPNGTILTPDKPLEWKNPIGDPIPGRKGVLAIEYRDIYGDEFLSGWAYRIEKGQTDISRLMIPCDPIFPVKR